MSNVDWYKRHLPAPEPTAPALRVPQAPAPYQPQQARVGAPVAPPQQPPMVVPLEEGVEDPEGQMDMSTAITRWRGNPKGGAGERQSCPRCGGSHYFSRKQSGTVTKTDGTRVTPSPLCADCGYNGMWEQFGDQFDSQGNPNS